MIEKLRDEISNLERKLGHKVAELESALASVPLLT